MPILIDLWRVLQAALDDVAQRPREQRTSDLKGAEGLWRRCNGQGQDRSSPAWAVGLHWTEMEIIIGPGAPTTHWSLAMVRAYLPAGVLRTCEFQAASSPQQVAAGLEWLVDRGI